MGNGEVSGPYQCLLVLVVDISVHNGGLRVLLVDINCVDRNISTSNWGICVLSVYSSRSKLHEAEFAFN